MQTDSCLRNASLSVIQDPRCIQAAKVRRFLELLLVAKTDLKVALRVIGKGYQRSP
jgi:hypothetical protein